MAVKNKLYKHHRSKAALTVRNLSIAFGGFFLLVALLAIPTYIGNQSIEQVQAQKAENDPKKENSYELKILAFKEN